MNEAEQKISKTIGSSVARYLALDLTHDEIAAALNIPREIVDKVARGTLVKRKVRELRDEIDREMVEAAALDPVRAYAKGRALKAVQTLAAESESTAEDSSPTSRINASKEILKISGAYAEEHKDAAGITINISAAKLHEAGNIAKAVAEAVPDCVDS